ncbi:hypothetical protein U0070_018727 [Myodes glareolus]|uniref:Uncharacterized protein n=1 Tax=Myodes glareolus TaxID=447135 RepID=A0AAW0I2Q6_MYOGA
MRKPGGRNMKTELCPAPASAPKLRNAKGSPKPLRAGEDAVSTPSGVRLTPRPPGFLYPRTCGRGTVCPGIGTTHGGPGPPTSIIKEENTTDFPMDHFNGQADSQMEGRFARLAIY